MLALPVLDIAVTAGRRTVMDQKLEQFVLELMGSHNIMTIATLRADGWPQATTVAYVNDGVTIYFAADKNSQKLKNIAYSNKVSLTIDRDYEDWYKIKGLSMAATAENVTQPADIKYGLELLAKKFVTYADVLSPDDPGIAVVRVMPRIISILNYEIEFGHTDIVRV